MLKQTPPTGELAGSARRLVPARVLFAVCGAVVKSRSRMQWLLLFVVMVLMMTMAFSTLVRPRIATAATSSTLNFQARLQNASGAIVPDGTYNIQFKLYDVSTLGSALWTESYLNSASQGVTVRNGYISVSLGSITAFPGTISWDQDLWLTMNIGGTTTGAPSYDGEMSPRLKLTANAYAFRSKELAQYNSTTGFSSTLSLQGPTVGNQTFQIQDQGAAGTYTLLTSADADRAYIQNQNVSAQSTANFWISGTGKVAGGLLAPTLDTITAGALGIGGTNATSITLGKAGVDTAVAGNLIVGGTGVGKLGIGTTSPQAIFHVVSGNNTFRFNDGASSTTPNISVGTSGGKSLALMAGTNGSTFTFDNSGIFVISGDSKANIDGGTSNGGTLYLTVTGGGNLGLGTTTPSSLLSLFGTGSTRGIVLGDGAANSVNLYRSGSDTLKTDDSLVVGTALNVAGTSTVTGSSTVSVDSANAFRVQNASNADVFNVNTTNKSINVGTAATYTTIGSGSSYDGTFLAKTDYTTTSGVNFRYNSVDIDGDGDKDLIGSNYSTIVIQKNNGDGSFAAPTTKTPTLIGSTFGVGFADVDGDGDADLIAYDSTDAGNNAEILKNNGTGTLADTSSFYVPGPYGPNDVTPVDVDGDGDQDLVFNAGSVGLQVYKNNGSGTFTFDNNPSVVWYALRFEDMDGDGDKDMLGLDGTAHLHVSKNNGSGTFSAGDTYTTGTNNNGLAVADLDGDGDKDVVYGTDGALYIRKNNGDGTLASASTYAISGLTYPDIVTADFDGDGDQDLLATDNGAHKVYTIKNNGDATFAAKTEYLLGAAPGNGLVVSDLNGDGSPDFAVRNGATTLSVFLQDVGAPATVTVAATASIAASSADKTALTLQGFAGQSVDILHIQGSDATTFMNVASNGNVGIGAVADLTSSAYALTVQGGESVAGDFVLTNADASETLFTADTTNNRVIIGNASGDNTPTTLVIDSGTEPATGVAGAMYYDTSSNSFRCYTVSWGACGGDGLVGSGGENKIAKFNVDGDLTESKLSDDGSTLSYTGANILLGNGGASPAATSIKAAPASGTNVKGGDLTIDASNGTGSGGSGDIILRTAAPAAGSGTPTVGTYTRSGNGNANQLTFSHTSDSGSNKLLLVQVVIQSNGASVSSVSYGGQALTKINAIGHNYNSNRVEMWYLLNPPNGAANVVVNLSAYRAVQAVAMNLTGVNQTTPLGAGSTNQGSGSTASTSVTATNLDTVISVVSGDSGAPTVAAGQTQIWNAQQGVYGAGSYLSGTGTVTATWTGSLNNWVIAAVPVLSAASSSATNILTEGIRVTNLGRVGINASVPGAMLQAATNGAGIVGQIIQGSAGQTADLLQLKDTNGYINASFNASGNQLTLGRVATSGTVTQGKLVLADGTVSGYSVTLQSADTLTANRTIKLPDASGTICTTATCAAGSGTDTHIARFNSSGALTDSGLTESGTTLSYTGALTVQTASALASVLTLKDTTGTVSLEVRAGNGSNALIGVGAGQNTTGGGNTALGYAALQSNVTASSNTAIGNGAMQLNTGGSGNVALGYYAYQAATGGTNNTALGAYALQYNTSGGYNIGIGTYSLGANTTGSNNIALGQYAMNSNQTGTANIALGQNALRSGTAGSYNVALGYNTLRFTGADYNVGLGYYAGYNNSTGSRNVFIGYNAGYNETGSDKLYIANNSTTALIQGDFSTSDLTFNSTLTLLGAANSATGFVIQRPSNGDTLFTANTSNNRLIVGNGAGLNTNTTLFVLDSATNDPTSGTAGAMFYNSGTGKFRCYTTAWADCAGGGGGGGSGWSLTGNASTTVGTNFVGTSDNQALLIQANSSAASPSSIQINSSSNDSIGAITISGNGPGGSSGGGTNWFVVQKTGGGTALGISGSGTTARVQVYLQPGSNIGASNHVCATGGYSTAALGTLGYCSGGDVAERYNSSQSLVPGQLVSVDESNYPNVLRSTGSTRATMMGIVSTAPNLTMDDGSAPNGYPIALVGRVPAKVNTEGGVIHAGDRITVSSVAGVGMKATEAGMVVGTALESYNGSGTGVIHVLVQPGYYDPAAASNMQGGNGVFTALNVSGAATVGELHVTGNATVGGNLTVGNTLTTVNLIVGGHILSQSSDAPTIEAGNAAGQDGEVTIDGTDTAGTLSVTVNAHPTDGSTPAEVLAAGELAAVTFHTPYENTPRVVITPTNADSVGAPVYLVKDEDGYKVMITAAAKDGVTYQFDYVIVGAGTATAVAP